jgi:tetratricopeptide (TPR) repeat protein
MGNALKDDRQYEEALKHYKQALDTFCDLTNAEKDKAMCLFNMGNTLNNLWRYEESLTYYELAMEIFRNLPNSSERDQADCLQNMSNTLNDLQRYEEALQYYEQALDIYRTQPNAEMDQAMCLFNMGNTLYNVRRYDEALTRYEAAIDIYRTQPNTEKDQAGCLNNMGNALKDGRQYEEALKHYKQALDIFRNLTNTEKDQASCLNNIGSTILGLRRYDEALEHFKQAMEIYHALPNTEREQATCLFNMGNTLLHLSRYDEALERFEAALMIFQGLPNVDLEQGLCLQTMGFTYAAMGVWSQALDLIYRGFSGRWAWHLPALPTLSETQKKMFLDKQLDGSHPLYTVSLMQGDSLDLAAHHGLDVALMSKGLVEWAMQQEQAVFLEKATEDDDWKKAYEELQQWRREHAALAHTLTSSLHMQSELESPEARKGWEARLRTLEERIAAREQDLARRNAPLAAEMRLTAVDTPAVSHALSTLGDNTCLLEYVKYREADFTSGTLEAARYGVYLLRSGSEAPVGIDLGPAQVIDEAIAAFRGAIDAMPSFLEKNRTYPKGVQSRQITAQYTEAGQTLRALIFDPVLPYVGTDTQLFVAPDAELFRLPFEALPSPVEAASGGRYLVEDYGFVYLNSGRELLRFVDRPLVGTSNNTAVIVSNPDVRMPDTERAAQLVRLLDASPHGDREITLAQRPPNPEALLPGILGGAVLGSNTDVTLGVLLDGLDMISGADTFTEELFEFLEQSRRFDSVTVVQRKEALEECVQSLDGPRLLQILSHGVFLPMTERVADEDTLLMPGDASSHREIENPLLRSMLALAGASVSTSSHIYRLGERHFTEEEWLALDPSEREGDYTVIPLNDGRLTAYEVTGLDLYKTELVALTACSTALGDVGAGASVAGLRRAFTAAGAHSMIMAQWEVPVGPSMDQMKYFYEAWLGGGQGRYEAFRKSQLKVLADARKIKEVAGHPWFWAGFTYIGDPGLPAIVTTGSE